MEAAKRSHSWSIFNHKQERFMSWSRDHKAFAVDTLVHLSVLPDICLSSFKDPLSSALLNRTLYTDILQLLLDVPWPLQARQIYGLRVRCSYCFSVSNFDRLADEAQVLRNKCLNPIIPTLFSARRQ